VCGLAGRFDDRILWNSKGSDISLATMIPSLSSACESFSFNPPVRDRLLYDMNGTSFLHFPLFYASRAAGWQRAQLGGVVSGVAPLEGGSLPVRCTLPRMNPYTHLRELFPATFHGQGPFWPFLFCPFRVLYGRFA
jgi:hypothetical protein